MNFNEEAKTYSINIKNIKDSAETHLHVYASGLQDR